jgi:DNA-binding transcriptional ArsR family regulator
MDADAQVAPVAALVADATRATILFALSDGRALPACDLALHAGVTAATISYQLEKLIAGGLVAADRQGRHRYYRLASPTVIGLLEALATVAPPAPAKTFREGQEGKALRLARTCYDHLAGQLGVRIAEALLAGGCLVPMSHAASSRAAANGLGSKARDYVLTPAGVRLFRRLAVDVAGARSARRSFARACLDWSERRHHLAGALGAALLDRLFELGWIERTPSSRAVRLSDPGRRGLRDHFQIEI